MRRSILSTVIVASLSCMAGASQVYHNAIAGHTLEQTDGVEATFNKKATLKHAIKVGDDGIRVIIQLNDAPMAQYEAVNPRMRSEVASKGQKVDFNGASAKDYQTFLSQQQQSFLQQASKANINFNADFRYTVAFNGMAGVVSKTQLDSIASLPNVKAVYPDTVVRARMDASLDLIKAPQVWEKLGGVANAGAGVRVAIIDSGIRPENPLFNDSGFVSPAANTLPDDDYCSQVADFCNNKLIVARYATVPPDFEIVEEEYDSPLDYDGHGTHVAGIAVGNNDVIATGSGVTAEISGVAPGAYLMVYKGLYATPDDPTSSSGSNSMLLSMLEAALLDGADVVNNSWGSDAGSSPVNSPYKDVFNAMEDAGVVVVFAAGNDGPEPQTVGCPGCSDNVLTVAATSTGRLYANEVRISGDTQTGPIPALLSGDVNVFSPITAPVIYAGELPGRDGKACSAFNDSDAFNDAIALIVRGTCNFADKIANAEAAGAIAVLIYNSDKSGEAPILMGGLSPDQRIPSLMLPHTSGAALADLVSASDEEIVATIGDEVVRTSSAELADIMADFSGRGPNGDPDFLKPNIAAPGVRIFSGQSPDAPGAANQNFSFKSGTSMAAPHVAGAAALLKQLHPDWSAMQIKSALVSSSVRDGVVKEDGSTPADVFDMGAGRLDIARAASSELTFSELSLVDSACYVTCSLTTRVTNTSDSDVSISAATMFRDSQIDAFVSPETVTIAAGASVEIAMDIDVSTATQNTWSSGGITWQDNNDSTTDYFLPVALYPMEGDSPRLFYSTVSQQLAKPEEIVKTFAFTDNQAVTGPISISGTVDDKYEVFPESVAVNANGNQQSVNYDAETRRLTWEGELSPATLEFQSSSQVADYLAENDLPAFTSMRDLGYSPIVCSETCDDFAVTLELPVPITYLGKNYTSMQVSSNGFVSMGTSSGFITTTDAQVMPNIAEPNNILAPFWTDLDLDGTADTDDGSGEMYAVSVDDNWYVVEWSNAEIYQRPGPKYNFQIWFNLLNQSIHFVYGDMSTPSIDDAPDGVVVGAENANGTIGETYAAITQQQSIGALPTTADALMLTKTEGGSVEISYEGRIKDRNEYMDDLIRVEEDSSITANILANELDTSVVNSFTLDTVTGSYRAFSPITIDAPAIDKGSVQIVAGPANGVVEVNESGSVTYRPDNDFFGEDAFTYSVMAETQDQAGNRELSPIGEGEVRVIVEGVPDAPVLTVSAPSTVTEGQTYTVTASATDADGDDVTITINGIRQSTFSGTAPDADEGTITLTVVASDGTRTTTQTVRISVSNATASGSGGGGSGGGGAMGLLLLLAPLAFLRRHRKRLHVVIR